MLTTRTNRQILSKPLKCSLWIAVVTFVMFLTSSSAVAELRVSVEEPKRSGEKSVIKLELANGFPEAIESARAVVFLLDATGKVVGQSTRWIIGGSPNRNSLPPSASTNFNFIVGDDKAFTTTKVSVTRVVLAGGKLADVSKTVVVQKGQNVEK